VGQRIEVLSQPVRRSVKVFGALSLSHNPRFSFAFAERFNAQTFLRFLKRLVNSSPRKILMILDNVRYHHARIVREWVDDNRDRIELHFVPPYSPEFNAIENLWRLTKRVTTHNRHFATLQDLRTRLFRRFNRYQGNPASLRGLVKSLLKTD
jgi:transposase